MPDDSTQLIIISLSVRLSLRLVRESGSGCWRRRPGAERLEVTARAAASLSPVRGPGSLRRLGSRWHRPWGSGRASSRASSPVERQPGPPPGPQPLLSGAGLLRGGAKGSLCLISAPSSAAPSPTHSVPLRRSLLSLPPPLPFPPVILIITTVSALEGTLTRDRARWDPGRRRGEAGRGRQPRTALRGEAAETFHAGVSTFAPWTEPQPAELQTDREQ